MNTTLKISHLVVNGCSLTYGQGIVDPINDAWPSIIAKRLGVPLVNLALPGIGNTRIQRRTLDYFFQDRCHSNNPFYIHAYTHSSRQERYIYRNGDDEIVQEYTMLDMDGGDHDHKTTYEKEAIIHSDDYHYYLLEKEKYHIWAGINGLLDSYNINHFSADYMPSAAYLAPIELQLAPSKDYLAPIEEDDTQNDIGEWMLKNALSLVTEIALHPSRLQNFDDITESPDLKLPCGHENERGHQVLADYIWKQIEKRYEDIEVVDLPHAKLHDILIPTPENVSQAALEHWYIPLRQSVAENNITGLFEPVYNCPRSFTQNVYYHHELELDYLNQDWDGKPEEATIIP